MKDKVQTSSNADATNTTEQEKIKKHKSSFKSITLILIILLFVLLVFVKQYNLKVSEIFEDSNSTLTTLSDPIEYESGDRYVFTVDEGDRIIGTKDGIKRVDKNDRTIYDQPYSINNPAVINKGKFTVSVDIGGNSAYVFDEKSLLYNVVSNYPIITYDINQAGMLVLVEENKDAHIISVFSNEGQVIFKRNTTIDSGGYPIDLALSNSGDELVVSYVDISGLEPVAKLVFFDIDSKGLYVIDQIVGSIHLENTLISEVITMGESYYIAFSGEYIKGYKLGNAVEEVFSIQLTNKIIDVAYEDGADFFVVAYGDPIPGNDNSLDGQVVLYDKYGNKVSNFNTKGNVDYLQVINDEIIIGENRTFVSVTKRGYTNWTYTATVDVIDLYPLDSSKVLLVGGNYYQVLKRISE